MFHAAAVCSMRSLCVRCRHGVFDAGTLQHLKAWMRSPHDSSCTGRWSVVDCTEGRRQKCVEVSSTTRCKPYHDTARSAPHCRISVFVPFIATTFGGLGKEALKFIDMLSAYARHSSAAASHKTIMDDLKFGIAVKIQQGNYKIIDTAWRYHTRHRGSDD